MDIWSCTNGALGVKGNDGKHDTLTMSEGLVIYDNLYINPSKKAIVVDYSSKTIGTDKFTERLKLAGAGSVSDQHLAFTPGAAGKLSISFAHASSQGEPRFMAVNRKRYRNNCRKLRSAQLRQ